LIKITDKILISDFDGTLTVNDLEGLLGGVVDFNAVHPGYSELMKKLYERGVVLIWVTMRSLPFYRMSKEYLDKYLGVRGIMLMEP
jgi:phosphatidate phosphatase PAH1